jgi:hypothetical protein
VGHIFVLWIPRIPQETNIYNILSLHDAERFNNIGHHPQMKRCIKINRSQRSIITVFTQGSRYQLKEDNLLARDKDFEAGTPTGEHLRKFEAKRYSYFLHFDKGIKVDESKRTDI